MASTEITANILFFQASATAIPTLFVALAITSKFYNPEEMEKLGVLNPKSSFDVARVVWTLFYLFLCEMIALATLAANHPTPLATFAIALGFYLMFFSIMRSIITTLIGDQKSRFYRKKVLEFFYVSPLVLFFLFWLMLL